MTWRRIVAFFRRDRLDCELQEEMQFHLDQRAADYERAGLSMLYGTEPRDPATFAATAVFLAAIAIVAALVPASRAARVNPAKALRAD